MTRALPVRRSRRAGVWLVGAAAAVLVVSVVALVLRAGNQSAAAERMAAGAPVPLPSSTPTRIVSIVADEATLQPGQPGAAKDWPQVVARALHAQVFVVDSGDGYVRTAAKGDPTFVNNAGEVSPRADVVVFVGGRDDAGEPQSRLLGAAASAYASAVQTAPHAKLVVVGPVVAPPADLDVLAVRNQLWYAVTRTHAEFVDPIGEAWLTTGSFAADGGLTAAGRADFAGHMESVIRAALADR